MSEDSNDSSINVMDIWEHFDELRSRLTKALIALLLTTAISFAVADKMVNYLALPVGGISGLQSIEVTENISIFMKVSLLSGVILSFPFILWQLLAFILPGLLPHEKRWLLFSLPFATLMFLAGVAFAFYVMIPAAVPFLINFMGIRTMLRPENYFNFITNLMFWIGISFETPLFIYILARFRVVSAGQLAQHWRIAVIIIAVLAAIITPTPDPINMGLLMLPLFLLYGLSILLARLARPREESASPAQ
jgi:sec-independent protein translocase protein TatC